MKILVVVDMQNDFVDGALGTREAAAIVPKVVEKINSFDGSIAVTHDTHYDDYLNTQEGRHLPDAHCISGTPGWCLNASVQEALQKHICNGKEHWIQSFLKPTFGAVNLADWLCGVSNHTSIEEIVFIGLCTDICVISNAMLLKAFLPEVKITVDAACCAGVTPESHANALAAMKMCQINIENWEE